MRAISFLIIMKTTFTELKKATDLALNSKGGEDVNKHLLKAFALFSKEATHLEESYNILQKQLQEAKGELEKVNDELTQKVSELHTITHYLSNILKNISQGIIFINQEGIITIFNGAAQKILGQNEDKILFQSFWKNFSDTFFGFSMKSALELSLSNKLSYITLKAEKKELELCTTFVFEEDPKYRGLIIILRDITEMQKLQKMAHHNTRMKELGEMAAVVAHEIRNPLGGIRGYASLLLRDLATSPHLQEMTSHIIEGTQSLERIVNNILNFARPVTVQTAAIDLVALIKELCQCVKLDPSLPEEIEIITHFPKEPLIAFVDKELLRSALLNLLVNAFQAIDNLGKITVSLLKESTHCNITISDTGEGISPETIENIFSPFFTTKSQGTGLGLSEANKIIQAHGGTINVHSHLGVGTTFTITLPLRR